MKIISCCGGVTGTRNPAARAMYTMMTMMMMMMIGGVSIAMDACDARAFAPPTDNRRE